MKRKLHFVSKALTLLAVLLVGSMAKASDIAPGYYYMKGTEVSTAGGYYLRATSSDLARMISHEMTGTPTMDEKPFIWKVESMGDGFYSIQSIFDSRYLGGQIGSHLHHGSMSDAPHPIKFTFYDSYSGTVNIKNAWKLDAMTDKDSNYGTAMRPGQGGEALFLWYCDSQGGEVPAWYFEPVDAEAAAALAQTAGTYNGDEVEEGYYLVRANAANGSKPGAYLYANTGDIYRSYQDESCGEIDPNGLTDQSLKYIYYLKKTTEGYTFQNQLNGRYLGGSPNSNGHHAGSVVRPAPMTLKYSAERNSYVIEDLQQPANDFLPAYLNSGSEAFAWWAGSADWLMPNVYWDLVKLDASAVEAIAQRNLYVVGTLENARWDYETDLYKLEAKGNSLYTGSISVEDEGDGVGYFTFYSATMNGGNVIQYSSPAAGVQLFPGVVNNVTTGAGSNWTVQPGTWLVTIDLQNFTIRVNDPARPDEVYSLAYAELRSTIEATQEAWPGLDLSSITAVLNNEASTDDDLTAAKNRIPALIEAYVKKQMEEASESKPVDATTLVKNANCGSEGGWTAEGAFINDHTIYAANTAFDINQTITDIPNGVYEIRVSAFSRYGAPNTYYLQAGTLGADKHNAFIYATASGTCQATAVADIYDEQYSELGVSGEKDYSGEGWFVPSNPSSAKAYFAEGRYTESHLFVYVNDGTLTIGARRTDTAAEDLFIADNWTLRYYGNSAQALEKIATDLVETRPEIESVPAQATVLDAYLAALDAMNSVEDMSKATEAYTALAEACTALTNSQILYGKFQSYIEGVKATFGENPDLEGLSAALLKSYLYDTEEPGTFTNGSAPYILKNGQLDEEGLTAEMAQVNVMLENALKGGVAPGTDITALFRNMNFDEADFTGWTESHTGSGTCSGSHGLNTNPVAGWWNMDSIELTQTGTELPNGIYAITLNAYYRTGNPASCSTEDEMPAYVVVNGLKTPMLNILSDALAESDAEENVNCHSSDYSTGEVRFPDSPNGGSVAFAAGRYAQVAYGIVEDGVLSFGVCQDAYPSYDNDWMVIDNFRVVYMGNTADAANEMVAAQCERAEEMLASILTYRETTRNGLIEALELPANDLEGKCKKAELINQLCNEAIVTGSLSAVLEDALSDFYNMAQSSYQSGRISEEEYKTYDSEFMSAWEKLFGGLYTDEEIVELSKKYKELAVSLIPTVPSGYYYMKASPASTIPGYYMSSSSSDLPFLVTHEMPEAPTMAEKQFIWKVEALGDGTASIQNIFDHRYLGGQVARYGHHGSMDLKPHAISFTYFSSTGDSQGEGWKLDADLDRDSGYGTAMRPGCGGENVFLWYCDSQQGEAPAWEFEPVDAEVAKVLEETTPEYKGVDIEEGFYYVRAAATNSSSAGYYLYYNSGDLYRTYQRAVDGDLSTTEVTEKEEPYVFHVTKQNGGYAFQNVKTERYIGGSPNDSGHHVGAVTWAAPLTLGFDEGLQAYTILDESQVHNNFLPAYLNSGSEAFAWWAGSADWLLSAIYWNLIRIDNGTMEAIQSTEADILRPTEGLYTIDGRKVGSDNVRPGLYIKANGSSVKKILVK